MEEVVFIPGQTGKRGGREVPRAPYIRATP